VSVFKIVLVLLLAVSLYFLYSKWQGRRAFEERQVRQDAAAEKMYARQEQRNQQIRDQLLQQARERREEQLRRNAPERERIARQFPDAYRDLGVKAARNLEDCLVTVRDLHFTGYDKQGNQYKQMMIQAQCGPSFEEQVLSQ
jgi:hypothetical protein